MLYSSVKLYFLLNVVTAYAVTAKCSSINNRTVSHTPGANKTISTLLLKKDSGLVVAQCCIVIHKKVNHYILCISKPENMLYIEIFLLPYIFRQLIKTRLFFTYGENLKTSTSIFPT